MAIFPKISIIGAGHVGSTCAHWLLSKKIGNVVLLDVNEDLAKGRALDLQQSGATYGTDQKVLGTSDYKDIQDSDIVIITAGQARKPGQDRSHLLKINASIIQKVCKGIKAHSPHSLVIVVTNPLDIMTWLSWKTLDFPHQKVVGMAGILDTARFRSFVAQELGVSARDVGAFVLGGHGDTMVILPRLVTIGGIPIREFLSEEKISGLIDRARRGGLEIVEYLKTSSAYYTPALSVVEMVEALLWNQKRILPCSTLLKGEYGAEGMYMGVLCLLGKGGVECVMEPALSEEEKNELKKSVETVKNQLKLLKNIIAQ